MRLRSSLQRAGSKLKGNYQHLKFGKAAADCQIQLKWTLRVLTLILNITASSVYQNWMAAVCGSFAEEWLNDQNVIIPRLDLKPWIIINIIIGVSSCTNFTDRLGSYIVSKRGGRDTIWFYCHNISLDTSFYFIARRNISFTKALICLTWGGARNINCFVSSVKGRVQ